MKKIYGFKKIGGMILKRNIEINDEELQELIGKKGLTKLDLMLRRDIGYINLGKSVGIPAQQLLDEIQEKIDKAILEQNNELQFYNN